MLVVIGLLPDSFAVNIDMTGDRIAAIAKAMPAAADLIGRYGDDQKALGVEAAGKQHLVPAQGTSAELAAARVIPSAPPKW
jgi:hypothetical protein